MSNDYAVSAQTCIRLVHLKVSDLERALDFYCGLMGFEITTTYGDQSAFILASVYHHHIERNIWHSKGWPPAPKNSAGLFHTAIRYPIRKDLTEILVRLRNKNYPLTGASDHGVLEAL